MGEYGSLPNNVELFTTKKRPAPSEANRLKPDEICVNSFAMLANFNWSVIGIVFTAGLLKGVLTCPFKVAQPSLCILLLERCTALRFAGILLASLSTVRGSDLWLVASRYRADMSFLVCHVSSFHITLVLPLIVGWLPICIIGVAHLVNPPVAIRTLSFFFGHSGLPLFRLLRLLLASLLPAPILLVSHSPTPMNRFPLC